MERKIKKKEPYRKLGFSALETVEIIGSLNVLLANYHVHYQKMRNFHWNVKGKDFFDLHKKFEELYNEAKDNSDAVAERIRVFGQTPVSTLKEYLETAEIKEVSTDLSGEAMVQETLSDFQVLLSFMVNVTDAAIHIGDVGTEDMISSFIKKMEETHWMFTAWMKNP